MIPGVYRVVQVVGNMPLLGGGSVMGVFEQSCLILLAGILCFACPATLHMGRKMQLAAILLSIGFVIQGTFFGRAPSPFLYFQF
jgi:apolipoprotein N-acyltransferase